MTAHERHLAGAVDAEKGVRRERRIAVSVSRTPRRVQATEAEQQAAAKWQRSRCS